MKLQILESTKNRLILLWPNSIPSVAHGLKRTMESETPKMAIHMVKVNENTSVMQDELIANRLGLIPLHSETIDEYLYNDECDCETVECQKCSVKITLDVTCTEDTCLVTSRDLRTNDPNVYPVHDSGIPDRACDGTECIVIAKLKRNQRLNIECVGKKGIGLENAKWSSTVGMCVRTVPHPIQDKAVVDLLNSQELCIHELQYNNRNGSLEPNDHECLKCSTGIDFSKPVSLFKIETDGSLSPKDVFLRSIQTLKNRTYQVLYELQHVV